MWNLPRQRVHRQKSPQTRLDLILSSPFIILIAIISKLHPFSATSHPVKIYLFRFMPALDDHYKLINLNIIFWNLYNMEIDSCSQDKLEAYSVLFNKTRFGFTSKINTQNLKIFSIETQQRLGKIPIKLNIHSLQLLPNNTSFNYLLMSEYQQIIPLIYLLRSQPAHCKIITTKIALQAARLYAQDFYNVVKKMNQIVTVPTYQKESEAYDNYEIEFNIDFGTWVGIFEGEEIQKFADRCVTVNYGQRFDTDRGIIVTAYPSGVNIGSSVWMLENTLTQNKVLWVQGISHHSWRACQEFYVDPAHSEINNVVFTAGVLSNLPTSNQDQQQQCLQFLSKMLQRINRSINSRVVLPDFLIIPDIINRISYESKDKLKRMIFTGVSMNKIMSYVNSYPQFLTFNHRKRIYEDPPVYPFDTYEQMRQKLICEGTIEQISAEKKLPPKQLILRSTPYVHFESDFHAYLVEGENQVAETICDKFYDINKLRAFLGERKIEKIICLCKFEEDIKNIPDLGQPFSLNILEQNIFIPDEGMYKYYTTEGPIPNLMCKYKKRNGWLKLSPMDEKFRQLSKDWTLKMEEQFGRYSIETVHRTDDQFMTRKTKIYIEKYRIIVESEDIRQLQIADQLFNQCTRLFKLA